MCQATPHDPTNHRKTTGAAEIRSLIGPRSAVDLPTLVVILAMVAGFPVLVWQTTTGLISPLIATLGGSCLMNLSFTAWHEPAHQTFSSSRFFNAAAGWIASAASVWPGYFARRREHLLHHRFEGSKARDPVYPRIQTTFWRFPFSLLAAMFSAKPTRVDPMPLSPKQRAADTLSSALVLSAIALACYGHFYWGLIWSWIVPRALIFGIHAYYICFFPHNVDGGGYQVLRIRPDWLLLRLLTMNQHLHGIHHRWPWIPWHKYRRVLKVMGSKRLAEDFDATVGKGS